MKLTQFFPFLDLKRYRWKDAYRDMIAALSTTPAAIPQGIAYAVIAGLPPVVGLYASTWPTIVGGLFRSSRHVITGPTNALSLLVGGGIALLVGQDPMTTAITLALLVGTFQFLAGVLRLGAVVDYISNPVVLGYITGAGLLIGIGQLPNVTATPSVRKVVPLGSEFLAWFSSLGHYRWWLAAVCVLLGLGLVAARRTRRMLPGLLLALLLSVPLSLLVFPNYVHVLQKIWGWLNTLSLTNWVSVAMALSTTALIVIMRKLRRSWPSALLSMVAATAASMLLGLPEQGLKVVGDLAPVPAGLPPLSLPDLSLVQTLLPLAIACTVLSLVESSSVARAIAARTGQKLNTTAEFTGQGLANITAAFCGGYPTSGSLSRSALNEQGGAVSRLAGVFAGLLMLLVLQLLGPMANHIPIASLAGLLLVVAVDLVDTQRIRTVMNSNMADQLAFLATMLGTWMMPLDKAIYLGVGISLVLFLQKARLLVVHEMAIDDDENLVAVPNSLEGYRRCGAIRVLHLEGRLFFGVEGELQTALDHVILQPDVQVLLVRLKRTQGMDVTVSHTLAAASKRLAEEGRHLILAGVRSDAMDLLERTGTLQIIGREKVFSSRLKYFASMKAATSLACQLATGTLTCDTCPLKHYILAQDEELLNRATREVPALEEGGKAEQ